MNPEDRRHATNLDRHWDAFSVEGTHPDLPPLDRETAALLTRMWALSAPPHPAMARERVWQRLQRRLDKESDMTAPALTQMPYRLPAAMLNPNGRVTSAPATIDRPARWRGIPTYFATAVMLLIALAVGLFGTGSLPRLWRTLSPPGLPIMLTAPATPAADATRAATLLDVVISPEQLPRGTRVSSIFEYATSPAGSTGHWLPENSAGQPGLRVHHLLEGTIIVRAKEATQIVRAGGTAPETIAADAETALAPGDSWIAQNETEFEAINPNDDPARVLIWLLANVEDPGAVLNYPAPSAWIEENYTLDQPAPGTPGIEVPSGAARLRIQRIELEPKESYPPPGVGIQYGLAAPFTANGSPVIGPSVAAQPSGKLVNIGRKDATAYVLNFASTAEEMDTPPA